MKLSSIKLDDNNLPIKFVESLNVSNGVVCDVYKFIGEKNRDLGLIRIQSGCKTPKQNVLHGEKTIEGYITGSGRLIIIDVDGNKKEYSVPAKNRSFSYSVKVGEIMQWQADLDSDLFVYEICYPPYQKGRFENLPE